LEIKMNALLRAPMRLAFTLAVSLFALPALGAPTHETGHKPTHHRVADFAKARAFLNPAPVLFPEAILPSGLENHDRLRRLPETDGLGRNDEDCNMGCVDH
jgi:hypothetical protein